MDEFGPLNLQPVPAGNGLRSAGKQTPSPA